MVTPIEDGDVDAEVHRMSDLVLTRVRMGTTSGYTSQWCDAEHWGMVAAGRIAIEWEDDVEVLGTGDIYYCPPGPPGHRITAADPATMVDLTPLTSLETVTRLADWRRPLLELGSSSRRAAARGDGRAHLTDPPAVALEIPSGRPSRPHPRRPPRSQMDAVSCATGRHAPCSRVEGELDRGDDGTARNAPMNPPTAAPTSRLSRTRKGEIPTELRMTIGTSTLPSMSWRTT